MFNQLRGTIAPLPADDVATAYAPFGSRACCPGWRTSIRRCYAWEQANIFSGWMCLGRGGAVLRARYADRGRDRRGWRAAGARRGRRAARVRQRLPPPRPRAGAVRRGGQQAVDRLPVPRAGPTSSTARCATRPAASATSRTSTSRSSGWPSWTSWSGTAGCSSTPAVRPAPSSSTPPASSRSSPTTARRTWSPWRRTPTSSRRTGRSSSRTTRSATTALDPPRAVPGQPAAERREPRARRRVDGRLDGPDARRRRPCRSTAAAAASRSPASPTSRCAR